MKPDHDALLTQSKREDKATLPELQIFSCQRKSVKVLFRARELSSARSSWLCREKKRRTTKADEIEELFVPASFRSRESGNFREKMEEVDEPEKIYLTFCTVPTPWPRNVECWRTGSNAGPGDSNLEEKREKFIFTAFETESRRKLNVRCGMPLFIASDFFAAS